MERLQCWCWRVLGRVRLLFSPFEERLIFFLCSLSGVTGTHLNFACDASLDVFESVFKICCTAAQAPHFKHRGDPPRTERAENQQYVNINALHVIHRLSLSVDKVKEKVLNRGRRGGTAAGAARVVAAPPSPRQAARKEIDLEVGID